MQTGKALTFGRYEILAELGRGAMGIVYKAYDPKINRLVALKTISLEAADPSEQQACRGRFFREAEAAGRLSHPRIVAIFDIGEDPDTLNPYIVMEYVAGRSLEEILSSKNATLPLHSVLQLVQEVAEALDYAHCQGVVHRDVKPSNIIIGEDGHTKIADFGIAQLDSTRAGNPWGTPAYMSPEQFKGEPVDGRSDLFSLGVILYTLLTGHRPFQGDSALTISIRVVSRDPVPVTALNAELSPELDSVIARAMAKDPAERYQTGMDMVLDLQRLRNVIRVEKRQAIALQPTERTGSLKDVFFSSTSETSTGKSSENRDRPRDRNRKSDKPRAAVRFTLPWQQLGIALFSLGSLGLIFLGLWHAVPSTASRAHASLPPSPPAITQVAPENVAPALAAPEPQFSVAAPKTGGSRSGSAKALRPANSSPQQQPLSCQLRIAVVHHFVTAEVSVWIDDQPAYTHSLRGAIKKRVVLFKGVEGYLTDVVSLTAGKHQIRVRVLSADGSYDQSNSISETFASGSERLLTVDFDKHNRGMRLTLEPDKEF